MQTIILVNFVKKTKQQRAICIKYNKTGGDKLHRSYLFRLSQEFYMSNVLSRYASIRNENWSANNSSVFERSRPQICSICDMR